MGMDFLIFFHPMTDILIDLLLKCNFNKHYPPDKLLLVFPVYFSNLQKECIFSINRGEHLVVNNSTLLLYPVAVQFIEPLRPGLDESSRYGTPVY